MVRLLLGPIPPSHFRHPHASAFHARFIFTYGMLIYRQLGDKAQQEFAKVRSRRAWHVSLLSLSRVALGYRLGASATE